MNGKRIVVVSGLLGAAGILIGAFGAHLLPDIVTGLAADQFAQREAWLQTGVSYHMYHAVALLALGLFSYATNTKLGSPAVAWIIGVVLFSGSLYVMTLTGVRGLGAVVPVGGVSFVIGWVLVIVNAMSLRN